MNLKQVGSNMTELELSGGLKILFSYQTPVACRWSNASNSHYFYKTDKFWSRTTSKHVNAWVEKGVTDVKPQDYFDSLVKGA